MNLSRRSFIRNAGMSAAALAAIPRIVSASVKPGQRREDLIKTDSTLLFQGDSITDARREKERELPNRGPSFGTGYAFLAAAELLRIHPDRNLTIYNRGISGNKVFQLAGRWEKDCLELKPDLLSILIGVNDYWHKRNGRYDGTVEIYENDYRKLLERTRQALPGISLVICQPFILPNTRAVDESWLDAFRPYQLAARKIAEEYQAIWIPFQEVFNEAVNYAPEKYWAPDGVHPSMAGAQLMAEAWLKGVE